MEHLLRQFDRAWQSEEKPPSIDAFLPPLAAAGRAELLAELVRIDLEYRWRRKSDDGSPRILDDYVKQYPELGDPTHLSVELIGAEYFVRHWWGDRPGHAEYLARYPERGPALEQALCRIDAELAAERPATPQATPIAIPVASVGTPLDSAAALIDAIRASPFVKAAQLDELASQYPPGTIADAKELARSLIERGWLTEYQAAELLQGNGASLVLGSYLILEPLGQGATGQVFKARHLGMNRVVALKVIRDELLAQPGAVERFYKEIQAASKLAHPHVVHPYDAGPIRKTHYLAMEYMPGIDLGRLVKQSGPLPIADTLNYVIQAARGLQHIHEHGLVHRDIKPANLLLRIADCGLRIEDSQSPSQQTAAEVLPSQFAIRNSQSAIVKILDLGLARLQDRSDGDAPSTLTHAGTVMGTPDFMAPEQAKDAHAVDRRADLYSLGCTWYFMLTAQPPFPGGTFIEKVDRHRWEEPQPIEQLRPDIPAEAAAIVRKLMAKRPEDRYQSAAELEADLTALVSVPHSDADTSVLASPVSPAQTDSATALVSPAARPRTRRRLPLTVFLSGTLFSIGLLIFSVAWSQREEGTSSQAKVQTNPPPPTRPTVPATQPEMFVTDLAVASRRQCRLALAVSGQPFYTDRDYALTEVSPALQNAVLIRVPNDDKFETGGKALIFTLRVPATVYVFYVKADGLALPAWLTDGTWEATKEKCNTNDGGPVRKVFARRFPAGPVSLGGNLPATGAPSRPQYGVIVKPIAE